MLTQVAEQVLFRQGNVLDLFAALDPVLREHGFTINQLIPKVVLTADLQAASSDMDGTIVIEDGGAGNRNLVIYAGGQRFRIDGGAPF